MKMMTTTKRRNLVRTIAALFVGGAILSPTVQAQTYYWDVNGTTSGFSTVVGTWGTNLWNTDITGGAGGSTTATTTNAYDLNIVAATTNTGTITVSGTQVANSINFGSTVGAVTISGGTSITLGNGTSGAGGITVNSGSGAQVISTALILNNSQTWTNNSSNALTINSGVNLGANTLTFSGSGTFTANATANVISGTGGSVIMNGTGLLVLGGGGTNPTHTYTGTTTINNGTVQVYNIGTTGIPSGNLTLNGGILQDYFGNGGTFTRALGSAAGQVQILGGASGFSGAGGTSTTFNVGGSGATLVWGSSFFNPSTFVLQGNAGVNTNGKMSLTNGIDLNGSDRTITSTQVTDGAAGSGATIAGVISNSTGTAGFEKTGVGNLILGNAANTFNGALTITGGWITAGASGSLGNASATNTLIFNGGTLRATGTITSPSTRGVTMTQTGIIDNNGQAISIAGNIGGAGGLTKNSTGTLTLSGTNNYSGVTTVNAGTLAVTKTAALASNTAANLNVKSGATLQLNVGGSGEFAASDLNTLLGNISVANTSAQGLQAGAILALDTTNAGGTFTQVNAITNSTGSFGGLIALTKLGTGTLVLNQVNTYTGGTTISAGTLQLDSGGSLASSAVLNNSIYLINRNATTGTAGLTNIFGSGSVATGASGTLTINSANALAFNALNTTGGGSFGFSGVTTPTLGGLVGTTGNLSASFSSGYSSVTNLTLNTNGNSFSYGGVIDDGASGMSLTKTGAGTQTLTGNNTYTGTTFLNGGTLTLGSGSTIGRISGTTAVQFNGGSLQINRSGVSANVAIPTGTPITVNATGSFGATSADAGGANETLGALTLNAGQMNFNWTNSPSSGVAFTFASLSRSGTASANFNGLHTAAGGRWAVSGAGTTTAGTIIGPWYTTGGNGAGFASTDYAVFSSNFIAPANIAGSAETTWTTAANAYTTSAGGTVTLTGTRTITALRNTGATTVLTLASGADLQTYGLLNGVSTLLTVAPGTGGVLTTPANGGNLYVNAGAGAITISAPINNSGGSPTAVTLVKNGSSTLTLSSTTSNYSGGTVINGGTLAATADTNLGATAANAASITSAQAITVNGDTTLSLGTATYNRSISIASGANVFFANANTPTITGAVTGAGSISTTGGNSASSITLSSTSNTFTGGVLIGLSGGSSTGPTLNIASLADSSGAGNITFGYGFGAPATFNYMSTAVAPLTLNNRQIVVANTTTGANTRILNSNATNAITINTNLSVTTATTGTHTLNLDAVAGPTNVFAGAISNGGAGVLIAVSKTGAGSWTLSSNNNSYTGATNVSVGTLRLNNLNAIANSSSVTVASGATLQADNAGIYANTAPVALTGNGINTGATNFAGALHFGSGGATTTTWNAPITLGAANTRITSFGVTMNQTLGGTISGTGPLEISSRGGTSASHTAVWTLGAANNYSGNTAIVNNDGLKDITVRLGVTNALPTTTSLNLSATNSATTDAVFTTLDLNGFSQTLAGLTDTGGAATLVGASSSKRVINSSATLSTLTINNAGAVTYGTSGTRILAGTLGGLDAAGNPANNLALTKTGAGVLTLAGNGSSFTGDILISNGTLTASGTNSVVNPTTSALGNPQTASRLITVSSGGTLNFSISDVMGNAGSTPVVKLVANGGTIRNTGAMFNTLGPVDLNGGTLSSFGGSSTNFPSFYLNGTVTVGGSAVSTISSTGANSQIGLRSGVGTTFDVADAVAGSGSDLNVTGVLANWNSTLVVGALTKTGAGTMTLSGNNTYTGTTTVSQGTLIVGDGTSGSIGASATTVNSGATLGGSGTIGGATIVNGSVAPGNSAIGTLSVTNNVTWNPGTGNAWKWELGPTNTSDLLNLTGDFIKGTGTGTWTFDFSGTGTAGTFKLVDWNGALTTSFVGTDFSASNLGGAFTSSFNVDNTDKALYLTLAPSGGGANNAISINAIASRVLAGTTISTGGTITNSGAATLNVALTSSSTPTVGSLATTGMAATVSSGGGTLNYTGSFDSGTAGTGKTVSVTNSDGSATPATATATSNSFDAVNQRSFSVGTPTIALGRFLTTATPASTSVISSSGLNASTANATLGSFAGTNTNGLTLTTTDSTAFNGGVATQTATYTIGGTATPGVLTSASFSSTIAAELGSIANVVVNVTGNAVDQRTFSVGTPTISLGRFMATATPSSTSVISSSGLNAVTANATLGSFVGTNTNGLTLTTVDSPIFNGGVATQTATYTIGGTATPGALTSASFSSPVTAELGSISNVVVNVTGNALLQRTITGPSSTFLGNFLLNGTGTVSIPVNVTSTTGDDSSRTQVNVAGTASADANGISIAGTTTLFDGLSGSASRTITGTFTGTGSPGTVSGSRSLSVSTNEAMSVGDTTPYAPVVVNYTANVGNASYAGGNSSAAPGTALSSLTPISVTAYTNLASNTVGLTSTGTTVPAIGTTATLLYYKNSTGSDTGVSMAWRSRKTVEASSAVPGDNGSTAVGYLISDVVTLTGMQNVTGVNATTPNQTDIFVLQMSYDQNKLGVDIASAANHEAAGGALGRIYLAWNDTLNGGWTNAVNGNIGGTNEFVFRGYLPGDELVLGRWGVDISNNVAWAVLNHNSEFAVIPEPSTLVLGGLALLGLAGVGLRRRRLAKQ